MNSPVRAMPDMKVDGAERAPILLAQSDIAPAATRGDVVVFGRPATSDALGDIVTARMKDLADRLAACAASPKAADLDAPLAQDDVEVQPVTLTAITGLRRLASTDINDDDWPPAAPITAVAPPASSHPAETTTAIAPPSMPAMSMRSSDTISERNLQSLLDVLERPAPLRLAGALPTGRLVPVAPTDMPPAVDDDDSSETIVATFDVDAPSSPVDGPAGSDPAARTKPPLTDEPLMLADQSDGDVRLVDLIKRQQSLLEQLNRYPPAPLPVEVPTEPRTAPPPTRSMVDQLDPTQPIIATDPRRAAATDVPPPLPSSGVLRLADPSPDDDEQRLPERSPMIIERARAERAGRYDTGNSAAAPSPLPAFAAGVAIAFAIAGSLLFVL